MRNHTMSRIGHTAMSQVAFLSKWYMFAYEDMAKAQAAKLQYSKAMERYIVPSVIQEDPVSIHESTEEEEYSSYNEE